jgi:monofunctional glycosyltransferase
MVATERSNGSEHPPPFSPRWGRSILWGVVFVASLPVLAWLLHPWPIILRWVNPSTTAYVEYRSAQAAEQGESLELQWSWIPLDSVTPALVRAVLVAEDDRFHEHRGVDWNALAEEVRYAGEIPPRFRSESDRAALRASLEYLREHRDDVRGRSTLTQQLARNLYLSPDRAFVRKGQELILARRLEFFLSKERILELYLNVAELGPGIFGVESAAQAYFDRSAADLSREQAAALAATLPHPLSSNPAQSPARMQWRQGLILGRMGGGAPPVPAADPVPEPEGLEEPRIEVEELQLPSTDTDTLPTRDLPGVTDPDTLPVDPDTLPLDPETQPPDPDTLPRSGNQTSLPPEPST